MELVHLRVQQLGHLLCGGAGAAMIAAEYVNTGRATASIPFALFTPIIGGMIGYYQQLNVIRNSKVKTTFHTNGSTAGLTFKF
ncbi:MAG: hypothetical protein R2813_10170 [Flavobacteriales bacterium]